MIVFVVSGIWHGANWTFLIWGALYGVLYILEKVLNSALKLEKEHNPTLSGIFSYRSKPLLWLL